MPPRDKHAAPAGRAVERSAPAPELIVRQRALNDMIEPTDRHEPIENSDPHDAIEPIDRHEPTEPTDNTEPLEPIDSTEF
jgi:hypothetical protein